MKVVVTGGAGRIGEAVVRELIEHGHEVVCVDQKEPEERLCPVRIADTTDFGHVVQVLRGADAVIHLAAIPYAGKHPDTQVFATNAVSHYNVLEAAWTLGVRRVTTASTIQVIAQVGAEDDPIWPSYFPVDEEHPIFPRQSYALSKEVGEKINEMFARRGMQALSLRFVGVTTVEHLGSLPPERRGDKRHFWSYVDLRDAAAACRLSVEVDGLGAEAFYIAAADTVREEPSVELIRTHFPGAEIREGLEGNTTCIDIRKARRLLGYSPKYTWRG